MRYLTLAAAISSLILASCGSDNKNDTTPPVVEPTNQAPTITLESSVTADEKSEVTIAASATDADGTIASYAWQVSSVENDIVLANADSASVTATLPEVMKDTLRTLTLTVTDNDGDTASATVDIDITQITIPLTITGLATDSPIQNANIEVHVAGMDQPFESTADANGEYSVSFEVDDSLTDAFVTIQAAGINEQASAVLVSMLGNLTTLTELAGDDGNLSAEDYFPVNITHITTAQYGLATQSADSEIATDAELQSALNNLDYNEVLWLAAAIKVAVDKADEDSSLALPTGVTDTLAMVSDAALTRMYLAQVEESTAFTDAIAETFADPNVVDSVSEWSLPDRYYFAPEDGISSNIVADINPDGTGQLGSSAITWELTDGTLTATLDPSTLSTSFVNAEVNGQIVQVQQITGNERYVAMRIATSDLADTLFVTRISVIRYPNGELPDQEFANQYIQLAYKDSAFSDITFSAPTKAYLTMQPVTSSSHYILADTFSLNADGTGSSLLAQATFDWQLADGALVFTNISNRDSNVTISYRQIATTGAFDYFVYQDFEDGSEVLTQVGKGSIADVVPAWNTDDIPGIYALIDGISTNPQLKVWFELHENGEADYYFHANQFTETYVTTKQYALWSIDTDGGLNIQIGIDPTTYQSTEACRDYLTTGCVQGESFTFTRIAEQNGVNAVLNKQVYFSGFFYSETVTLESIAAHLEPVDQFDTPTLNSAFKSSDLINQGLSLFDDSGDFLFNLHFDSSNAFTDQTGATGTWQIEDGGTLTFSWAGSAEHILTAVEYSSENNAYQVNWQDNNDVVTAATLYLKDTEEYAFTTDELWGNTFYFAFDSGDADCPNESYVIEPITFSSTGTYTLDTCYTDELEVSTYDLLENGNVRINYTDLEYMKKVAYNSDVGGWLLCYEQDAADLCSIANTELGYFIADFADAQAYVDSKNGD